MRWETVTEVRFKRVIAKIPVFHRHIAEEAVSRKASANALERGGDEVREGDVLSAFFSDVPTPFYSMMVRLLEEEGFDYKRYGLPKARTREQAP